ncbi:MAG: hypothetical protein QW294_02800 [Candidatus Bathyarchaeia archaeon]
MNYNVSLRVKAGASSTSSAIPMLKISDDALCFLTANIFLAQVAF